jgi:hypothetical protein
MNRLDDVGLALAILGVGLFFGGVTGLWSYRGALREAFRWLCGVGGGLAVIGVMCIGVAAIVNGGIDFH